MGLEDRYQLLAVRKIVGKHQMSILPVSASFVFYLIARNLAVRTMIELCKTHEKNHVQHCENWGKCAFDW